MPQKIPFQHITNLSHKKNTFPKHQTPVQQLWTLDIKLPFNKHQHPFQQLFGWIKIVELLLMAEILHQFIGSLYHYL